MSLFDDLEDPLLETAQMTLRGRDGQQALGDLGWSELLPMLDIDPEARRAVFAFFRAQGRELSVSNALGQLMALPYRDVSGGSGVTVSAAERRSPRRGVQYLVVGPPAPGQIAVDRPGLGVSLLDAETTAFRTVDLPGGPALREIETDIDAPETWIPESEALARRSRRLQLGRLAAAHEILGASEAAFSVAVQHAGLREQFGRPIAGFQAVRHLLAAAQVDLAAIEALATQAVDTYPELPPLHDAVLKAVAGRNGRRACERSLQVLGAMGFTSEHSHHQHHNRVLTLDTLLGTSIELAHRLAEAQRASKGALPDLSLPAAADFAG